MPTLDWVNKSQALEATRAVPVHLLKQETAFGDADAGDNLLIQGDNLLALKALLPVYAGRVKCISIDDDSREKKQVGDQWEMSSSESCLFLFAVAEDEDGQAVSRQIADKIG